MTYHEFIQVLFDRASAEGAPAAGSLAYLGFAPDSYTIKVTGKPNWVWVRLAGEDERTPTQALNLAQVRLFPDLPVRVRKEGGVLAVVGYDPATIDAFLGNRPITITSPEANEPDLVGPRRIKPGLVHAYKANDAYSMTVQVEGFWYLDPADRKVRYQPPSTLNLTGYIPAGTNQHAYVLVVFDRASKTLSAISGTPKLVTLPLDDSDITGIATGSAVPLCAVKLTTGMVALDKDYYFVDVRPWWTIAGDPLLVAGGALLTISTGAVTATQTYHILAAETSTTDDLHTVTAAADNTFLLLQADAGDTIAVKHAAGNIKLNDATDFVLSGDRTLLLFYDGTTWSDLGAGGGGGGGGLDWFDPQTPPPIPDSLDDEFNDATLDAAWSWSVAPNGVDLTGFPSWLMVNLTADATHELRKDFAPGASTPFGLEVMLSFPGWETGDKLGLAVLDNSNNHIADFMVGYVEDGIKFVSAYPDNPYFNARGSELIVNGSAESALGSEWVTNNVARDSTVPYSGSYCLRGSNVAATTTQYANYARQTVSITETGRHVLSCYLRRHHLDGNGGSYSRVRAKLVDPDSFTIWESSIISSPSWVKLQTTVNVTKLGNWTFWFTPFSASTGVGWDASRGACDLVSFYPEAYYTAPPGTRLFLRLHRDASDIYRFWYSDDGVTWRLKYTSNTVGSTVSKLALVFASGSAVPKTYGVHYVRRYA